MSEATMKFSPDFEKIKLIRQSPDSSMSALAYLAELNPKTDFSYADLHDVVWGVGEHETFNLSEIAVSDDSDYSEIASTNISDVSPADYRQLSRLASVGRVHEDVSRMFASGQRDEAVLLVRDMLHQFRTQTGTLRPAGDPKGDWFNLSAVLGRNDEEGLALEVCLAGLEQQNGTAVFK